MIPRGSTRALRASLAGAVAVVLATAIGLLVVIRQQELREARARDASEVARFLAAQEEARTELMDAVLLAIKGDRMLENAFRSRRADRLLELAAPLFDTLRVRHGIHQLYFIAPDRRVLLRVHEPSRSGDSLTSVVLAQAAEGLEMASGIEAGPLRGLPAFRVAAPWRDGDELIGFVELGTGLSGAAGFLRDALGLHGFVVLSKEGVSRATFEEAARSLGRPADWDRYPSVVIVDRTLADPPAEIAERYRTLTVPGTPDVLSATVLGRTHEGQVFPLLDVSGRTVGELVFLRDRSRLLADFNQAALGFAGVFALVALAIWLGLRRTLSRHFVRPLTELVRVTEAAGRGDLAETMLAQRRDEMGDLGRAVNLMIGELRVAQEERTRKIVDAAQDAVVTADASGVITGWNAAAQTIFGWTRAQAVGLTLTETVVPESAHAAHLGGMLRMREGGLGTILNRRIEVTARRKSGEHFPAELTLTMVESGGERSFAAFIRDITERREGEQALRATEERFRRLLETANVVPWEASSRTTRLTYVGPQAEALLGFPLPDWFQEGFWMRQLHPDDREHALTRIAAAVSSTEACEFEYRMIRRDGAVVWVRDIVAADVTADGPVLRGFRFDVTERRRLEEELLQSRKMEAIGRLAGGIAHDFNNLLTAIIGYASLVESSLPDNSQTRTDLAEIKRAADQAADLTQQLLAFARKQVIRPRALVVDDLVRRLEKMMARLLGEDVAVVTRVEAGDAAVWVDPSSLEQALMNLILNARDAMPRGGTLALSTAVVEVDEARAAAEDVPAGTYAMIVVADTGTGMDDYVLAHVFEPFFTTRKQGTGLGLSTTYGVVRQARGFIEVDSAPDQGSAFRVLLPLARDVPNEAGAPLAGPPMVAGDETILVAEDEPQLRRLTERALLRGGYRVLVAQNGAEAVAMSRSHGTVIHLLVTDVVMPVMGGVRAADTIRAERPGIRVLFVSGYSEESLFRSGGEEGVAFLGKPFTPQELEKKVREVLDGVAVG